MQVTLEVRAGPSAGLKIELQPGQTLTVGRMKPAAVTVPSDGLLSNLHFELTCDEEYCRVRDLNSKFGITLNKKKVTEDVLFNGDVLVAGQTTFQVRVVGGSTVPPPTAQAPAKPAVPPPAKPQAAPAKPLVVAATAAVAAAAVAAATAPKPSPTTPRERLLHILRSQAEPLYAILDGARNDSIPYLVRDAGEEYQSLYEGPEGEKMAGVAPYLVRLPPQARLLDMLVVGGWGDSWGVYLTCKESLKDLRKHLRHFLMVQQEDGKKLYFRFYDPRVLRIFLPTCNGGELQQFFGPIKHYLVEAAEPDVLLDCIAAPNGVQVAPLALKAAAAAARR